MTKVKKEKANKHTEGKAQRIMVIDGNYYLHRAYSVLQTSRPTEVALPPKFINMICKDTLACRATRLLVAFDGANVFRHKLFDGYKANRGEASSKVAPTITEQAMDASRSKKRTAVVAAKERDAEAGDDNVYQFLGHVFIELQNAGIAFFQPDTYEADDVLCSMAAYYAPHHQVLGGTKDKDAYQWITDRAWTYDSTAKDKQGKPAPRMVKVADVIKAKGVRPDQMRDLQILMGDKIDAVPGLPGYGQKTAAKVLNEFGTIKEWHAKGGPKVRSLLNVHQEQMRMVRKMVELCTDVLPPQSLDELKLERRDRKKLQHLGPSYHDLYDFINPKTIGLFGARR